MNKHASHIEASEELARLLDEMADAEEIIITRRRKPVAHLLPMPRHYREEVRETIHRLRELRDMGRK